MGVGGVEAGGCGVQVLAVDLQAVEAPLPDRLADEGPRLRADGLPGRTQVAGVPPRDLLERPVGVAEERVGARPLLRASGIRRERSPPQLGLEARRVDGVHERLHVGVASRVLRGDRRPVAFRHLPAVVEGHPAEAELLHDRQAGEDLVGREGAAVAPRAPDRLERRPRCHGRAEALAAHEPAVRREGPEVVALVHRHEGAQRREALARPEGTARREADRERRGGSVRARDRQRDEPWRRLHVAHGEAEAAPPHVHDRRAPSVVGGVHALVVVLGKADLEGQDPVGTLLVRAALVGPEGGLFPARRRRHGVAAVRPAPDVELSVAVVRVHGLHDREPREVVVEGDLDGPAEVARAGSQPVPPSAADRVGDRLLVLRLEPVPHDLARFRVERFRRGEGTGHHLHAAPRRDDAASERLVELQADALPIEPHDRRVGRWRLQGQERRESQDAEHAVHGSTLPRSIGRHSSASRLTAV